MSGMAEVSPKYLAEVASSAIPVGYKQTEVGLIPEDWLILTLGDIAELTSSKRIFESDYVKSGVPFYRGQEISSLLNGSVIENVIYISQAKFNELAARFGAPKAGEILITAVGTLGNSFLVESNDPFYFKDGNLIWLRKIKNCQPKYLIKQLNYNKNRVLECAIGSSQKALTMVSLSPLLIPVPSKIEEQTTIANALSDVDALISELEKLIAKKQAIKTATMQQLLTGRTRLPQFSLREDGTPKGTKPSELGEIPEDWEVKAYGEVFTFLSTSTNSRADLSEEGDFGYVHYGDIHTEWNNKLDLNKERLPRISKNIVSSAFVMDGDLIMADASEDYEGIGKTVEVFNVGDKQLVAGLHTFLLRDKEKVLADGFRGYLHSIPAVKSSFDRLATGMKVYGISKNNLSSVCFPVPSLEEQTAIAAILSDMDAEIQALEQRLGKTRQIKQGMMQELLTGRIRLPI
ncbi:restriction endonuclease subunit S [Methylophaga marina]|uniref:Restriction endonuclease subunit S n=1 Tax=Methylophaga marina TaxID=45495 RepID=A0ABP3DKK2_9GAMM|nr:restriction endonuclease subunit S [Methylophaga marina]BDZ74884.1 restriction endonuclease subunit S [Methylophaga marina]